VILGPKETLDPKEIKAPKVLWALSATPVTLEIRVPSVKPEQPVSKETRVPLATLE
jgi:hypothetical protein